MPKHAIAAGTILAFCAGPALAELTAEGLWADWQRLYAGMGAELSAESEDFSDGRLQLDGLTGTSTVGEVESRFSFGSLGLVEQADGSILIDLPETLEMTTQTEVEGETVNQTITVETAGWSGIVREDGVTRIYDLDADSQIIRIEDPNAETPVTATIALTDMAAGYVTSETGGTMAFDQTLTASTVAIDAEGGGPQSFDMTYTMSNVASDASGTLDLSGDTQSASLSQMGLLFSGEATHGGSVTAVSGMSDAGPFTFEGSAGAGRIGFAAGEDSLSYEIASQDGRMMVQVASLPIPLNASLSEISTGVTLPIGVSETPKPFGLSLALRELVLDDQLWSMFDPTGQLSREPATIAIELDGEAVMRADIFGDPEAMMALGGPPGELRSLDIAELLVSLAGAELTGDGSVTFENAGPIPQPVGTVTLNLTGGFALMDSLVALGFIPAQQAAMVRGMSGMVAEPVGEDALRSVIEFTEGGGITANGMPMR